jgi:predicted MFS family arabinose efflux permease
MLKLKFVWPLRLLWVSLLILPFLGYSYFFFLASLLTALFSLILYPVLQSNQISQMNYSKEEFSQNLMQEMDRRKYSDKISHGNKD